MLALSRTPSGPSSESAKRIVKPPMPANAKPPSTPTKKMRSSTGVIVSSGSIMLPDRVDLEDAADQRRVDLAAEDVALDLDADRRDVDDRELAGEQLADVDLDALDRAGELAPRPCP